MSLYDDYDLVTDFGASKTSETQNNDIVNWSNNTYKLLQLQVEGAKKRQQQLQNASSSLKREKPSANIAPVIDLSDKRGKPQLQLKKDPIEPLLSIYAPLGSSAVSLNQMPPTSALASGPSYSASSNEIRFNTLTGKIEKEDTQSIYLNSSEEYDPSRPNEYEKLVHEREKASRMNKENKHDDKRSRRSNSSESSSNDRDSRSKKDEKRNSESSRSGHRRHRRHSKSSDEEDRDRKRKSSRGRDRDRSSKRRSRHSSSSGDEKRQKRKSDEFSSSNRRSNDDSSSKRPSGNSAAFAPPPSLLEENIPKITNNSEETAKPTTPAKSLYGGLLKAEKMMAKMGYKEGEGLGRNKQGMSIALQVEKTGRRSGRIIHEKDVIVEPLSVPVAAPIVTNPPCPVVQQPVVGVPSEIMKNMSKVVLLKNMVAPGDVDDDLEAETKEECQKYGEVNKCVIYEMPNQVPEEAVRIFIEFKTLPSAIKALTDLNGRFFGGRVVKATFYNLDKFHRLELSDEF